MKNPQFKKQFVIQNQWMKDAIVEQVKFLILALKYVNQKTCKTDN